MLDVLVAEEQHLMLEQTRLERRERRVVDRLAQIDAAHLRAERARHAVECDPCHQKRLYPAVARSGK